MGRGRNVVAVADKEFMIYEHFTLGTDLLREKGNGGKIEQSRSINWFREIGKVAQVAKRRIGPCQFVPRSPKRPFREKEFDPQQARQESLAKVKKTVMGGAIASHGLRWRVLGRGRTELRSSLQHSLGRRVVLST